MQESDLALLDEAKRVLKRRLSFGGKASNNVGANRHVGTDGGQEDDRVLDLVGRGQDVGDGVAGGAADAGGAGKGSRVKLISRI